MNSIENFNLIERPERSLLDKRVTLVVGEVARVDEATTTVHLTDGRTLTYAQLVLATGSRIVPEAIEHFEAEAHHFYTAESEIDVLSETLPDVLAGAR